MGTPDTPKQSPTLKVKTTLPVIPPLSARCPVRTARLVLEPLSQEHLNGLHSLRTQPEVMLETSQGRPDRDLEETQQKLNNFLPPNDVNSYNFAICLASSGELIGVGGVHTVDSRFGWPEVGYMLKKEHWGRGFATEFMRGWLSAYWSLPRISVEQEFFADSVKDAVDGVVLERISADVVPENTGSLRIMSKVGAQRFTRWEEEDSRAGFEGQIVTLIGFLLLNNQTPTVEIASSEPLPN